MKRSIPARIAAFAAALLVTYGLVDSIAGYAYPVPADPVIAAAHVPASR